MKAPTFVLLMLLVHTTTCFQIGFIANVTYIPYDSNTTTIVLNESCTACRCLAKQMNYSGFNCFFNKNVCSMFATYSMNYNLNTTSNAIFYFFQLPPIQGYELPTTAILTTVIPTTQPIVYQNLTSKNDVLVGIWNTTAGGDSRAATMGKSNGQYPNANEGPASVLDYNVSTKYNSYGSANVSVKTLVAGVGTGFYVTMAVGPCVVNGFQFATANDAPERDPLTMTLEGSNVVNPSLLSVGASWTLIYDGPTGMLDVILPGRMLYVDPQNFSNTARFTSYRVIMTSQRGNASNLQYSELHLLGYT